MAQQTINVGSAPNDGLGDPIRTAYIKCNDNFSELFVRYQSSIPTSSLGALGDTAGMYAGDDSNFYYCIGNYDGSTNIWFRVNGSSF